MRNFKSHSAEKSEKGTFWDFLTFVLLQNIEKMKGGIFGDMKKNCEKKSQSRNNMHKKFWSKARLEPTSVCLADLKKFKNKLKGEPFGTLNNFRKSHKSEKRRECLIMPKSGNLLLRKACKKLSAYARARTRTLWVEKQASYH